MEFLSERDLKLLFYKVSEEYPSRIAFRKQGKEGFYGAVQSVEMGWHYSEKNSSIFKLAAELVEKITRRHPLVDGNKRLSLLAMHKFLSKNHYQTEISGGLLAEKIESLVDKECSVEDFSLFLKEHYFRK